MNYKTNTKRKEMKILTILGARPQFIKAGAISRTIREFNNGNLCICDSSFTSNNQSTNNQYTHTTITEIIVHTGQHFDKNMSDVFFEELHLPKPDYYLGINSLSHGAMTGQMMKKIEEVAFKEKPDVIMVYGDTNSTLAGALVGAKLHIPVAHVEAGLRSYNMQMPEELNRVLTDRVSTWLFCPTETAVNNLKKEGYPFPINYNTTPLTTQRIINVGDVMYDVALYYKQFAKRPNITNYQDTNILISNNFILCTIHRAENTDNPERLKNIFEALEEISKEIPIILPLHPRTKKIIQSLKFKIQNLIIVAPVSYLEMIWLLNNCTLVITDSGGLQKEAYFFNKPCITLREETEWIELVEIGVNKTVGADKEKIVETYHNYTIISHIIKHSNNLYGDGKASQKIIKELLK